MSTMTREQRIAWVATLKPGDAVAIPASGLYHRTMGPAWLRGGVGRLTGHQVIIHRDCVEIRVWKKDGSIASRKFDYIEPWDDAKEKDRKERIDRNNCDVFMSKLNVRTAPIETVRAVLAALKDMKP